MVMSVSWTRSSYFFVRSSYFFASVTQVSFRLEGIGDLVRTLADLDSQHDEGNEDHERADEFDRGDDARRDATTATRFGILHMSGSSMLIVSARGLGDALLEGRLDVLVLNSSHFVSAR